jgi:hypothetical protein
VSLQDELTQDEINQKIAFDQDLQYKKEALYELKGKRDFFENRNFVWFYKEFIENPYKAVRERHDNCEETNKGFILKGQVQAFKSLINLKTLINKEINNLQTAVKKMEESQHTPQDEKPEN